MDLNNFLNDYINKNDLKLIIYNLLDNQTNKLKITTELIYCGIIYKLYELTFTDDKQ